MRIAFEQVEAGRKELERDG